MHKCPSQFHLTQVCIPCNWRTFYGYMMLEVERVAIRTNVVYLPPEPHDLQAVSLDFNRVSAIVGSSVNVTGMLKVEVGQHNYFCLFFHTFWMGDDQPPCSISRQLSHLTAILRVPHDTIHTSARPLYDVGFCLPYVTSRGLFLCIVLFTSAQPSSLIGHRRIV